MANLRNSVFRAGLETLYFSGAHRALAPFCGGVGLIFTLHHVRPARKDSFQPNRLLEITPQFLEGAIERLRARGVELVTMNEVYRRLSQHDYTNRFAAFTFDDGYKDNLEHAYPIFRRYGLPFAIYVPTDFPDGAGDLWWLSLERCISLCDQLSLKMQGVPRTFRCQTAAQKDATYHTIYWWLRSLDEEMANMLRFQRGYQASARALTTMDENLDILINRTGRVGL